MTVRIRTTLAVLLALLALLGASAASAQSPGQLELWVTNQKGEANSSPPDSVLVYAVGQQVDGRPLFSLSQVLAGTATKLHAPSGILITADRVFVSNEPLTSDPACKSLPNAIALSETSPPLSICGSITVYDRTAIEAACSAGNTPTSVGFTNVAPSKTIEGNQAALFYPFGIAINTAADEFYVANQTRDAESGSINVYRLSTILTSNGTLNLKPLQVIRERLNGPSHIVFDAANNELFVSNTYSGSVTVYRRNPDGTFTLIREVRDKGAGTNPLQFVSGLARVDDAVAGEPDDKLFVAHGLPPFNGFISIYGRGPDPNDPTPTPLRQIVGIQTTIDDQKSLDEPTGLAFDPTPTRKWLFVGNNARTTSRGFISVFKSTDRDNATPLAKYREGSEGPLFSPVGLALATAASPVATGSDYTLTNSGNVTVPRGSPTTPSRVDVKITVTLNRPGTVTFALVTGLPPGVTAQPIAPATCTTSCDSTLTLLVSSAADLGTSPITVSTSGVFDELTQCNRSTTFNLTVTEATATLLTVLKQGRADPVPGFCAVTSDKLDIGGQKIDCGSKCSGLFPPDASPVTLTVALGAEATFLGWDGCSALLTNTSPSRCLVDLAQATAKTVTAVCDRLVHLTLKTDGTGSGTITSAPPPLSVVAACGTDCYIVNDVVELTANPSGSSRFVQWTPNCVPSGPQKCKVTLRDSTTVTATFNGQAPLTVVNLPLGGQGTVTSDKAGNDGQPISCPPACVKTFDVDTTVTLRYALVGNPIFVGWQPAECAGFDSPGQPHGQCVVRVPAAGTTVDAWFVGTLQQAFVARLYLNVLPGVRPSPQNINDLVNSVQVAPLLSVQALIDAFFDGPGRSVPASAEDAVRVVYRALLWREPTLDELNKGVRDGERNLRSAVAGSVEFQNLIATVFGTSGL